MRDNNNAKTNKLRRSYVFSLIAIALFTVNFVAVLSYLNYRSMVIDMQEDLISQVEKETISHMQIALNFGKDFFNYYGIQDVFKRFELHFKDSKAFIIDTDGKLLYETETNTLINSDALKNFLAEDSVRRAVQVKNDSSQDSIKLEANGYKAIFTPIYIENKITGYFGCLYTNEIFRAGFNSLAREIVILSVIFSAIICIVLLMFIFVIRSRNWVKKYGRINHNLERLIAVALIELCILFLSGITTEKYQEDYKSKIKDFVRFSLQNLGENIRRVKAQGVDLAKVPDLRDYIEKRVESLKVLHLVRLTENISDVRLTNERSDMISFVYNTGRGEANFYLEAEISENAMQRQNRDTILILMSSMIILLIFIFELNNLLRFFDVDININLDNGDTGESLGFFEEKMGLVLRFASFLCSTAEYMCLPYAAMMIRESGESLFGLSVGMTAALPISIESFTQLITIMILPRFMKRINIRALLIFSAVLMAACNFTSFMIGGALTIISCRALGGVAYAGFKQVTNFLITSGYETETGRSNNISQDVAGLLAGITCGAGMGAILSANAGYRITFLCSAFMFICYLILTLTMIPWKALKALHASEDLDAQSEKKSVRMKDIAKIILSREVIFFSVVIGTPLYIGAMLCMTLIPAICQAQKISAVTLSYCYIANGLTGIYIGPALVSAAKKKLGSHYSIAFTFALTALGIFIVKVPPVALMVIVSSMILGFLDGFGTPMVTDSFMSLNTVMNHVDESTALSFYWVLSYLLSMAAPIVAELLLLPSSGAVSPIMIGAVVYLIAAVMIFARQLAVKR